jgi:parallel beta-helix repeat protein
VIRVFSLAAVAALALAGSAFARPGAQPYDSQASLQRPAFLNILPTLPFAFGEVNLATIGVSDAELATVGPTSSAAAASASNLTVDDDLADCPNAQFTSIQAAVTAATPGAKIKVCRGTYVEQVTIPAGKDNLTLFSEGDLKAVIKAPPVMTTPKAIVRVNGAHNVTIRHFTITGPGGGPCDSLEYGVRVDGGGSAVITDNHITHIHDTPFSGCQNGNGVQIGRNFEGQSASGIVTHNLIDDYQKTGVVVDGLLMGAANTATVDHNEIVGVGPTGIIAQNGIQISRGAVATVDHNDISRNVYTGTTAASEGLLLFQAGASGSIDHNKAYLNDDGVSLYTTSSLLVGNNKLTDNTYDGIYADTDTANNQISHNDAKNNGAFDCEDNSAGPNTAGTANYWDKDKGDTENRPGLCKK